MCLLECLPADDGGVGILHEILFQLPVVDLLLPRQTEGRVLLLRQRIAGVFFILQDVLDTGELPVRSYPVWDSLCR